MLGPALPIVAGAFLAYTLLGHLLPSPLNHRGYDFEQVVEHMAFGTEGIYGTPTAVSATYIFLFILFGSFMEQAGVIRFFNEIVDRHLRRHARRARQRSASPPPR